MTTPTPPVDPTRRPSVPVLAAAHAETILNAVIAKLMALAGAVFFGYLTLIEVKSAAPSNVRLMWCAAPTMVCIGMLCTDPLVAFVRQLTPFLPSRWRGQP